jgi:hypothetical protein
MPAYRTNSPKVVSETIDNESVIINLDKGTYYSIRGIGSEIWDALRTGISSEQLVEEAASHSADESAALATQSFIDQLVAEELLVPAEPAETGEGVRFALPYSVPALMKYSDMEALLLLDPIHDVDEAGWPVIA